MWLTSCVRARWCCVIIIIIISIIQVSTQDNVQTTNQELMKAILALENNLASLIEDKVAGVHSRLSQMDITLEEVKVDIAFIKGDVDSIKGEVSAIGGRNSQSLLASERTYSELNYMKQNISKQFNTLAGNVVTLEENVSDTINDTTALLHNMMKQGLESLNDPIDVIKTAVLSLTEDADEVKMFHTNTSDLLHNISQSTSSLKGPLSVIRSKVLSIENIVENERCPVGLGFFQSPGSNQCFKFFADELRTWEEADEKCKSEGLVLPKPYDAVALRKYLMERYNNALGGSSGYWLDGRGDGSDMKWQRDSLPLSSTSPLWDTDPGTDITNSDCLFLLGHNDHLKAKPSQPYYSYPCYARQRTLCELI